MVLDKDGFERTAWHIASEKGQIELLRKLLEWAKEVLTPEKLKRMFLGIDGYERTASHIASEKDQIELLQKLWE